MPTAGVNQPPARVPQQFARDPALNDYFSQLNRVIFQLWQALTGGSSGEGGGSGSGYIEFQVSGGFLQYRTTTDGPWTQLISMSSLRGAPGAPGTPGTPGTDGHDGVGFLAAALARCDDVETSVLLSLATLRAQVGALHTRISDMPTTPKSMALNDQIAGTSDTTTDLVYSQTNGIGSIAQASVFNSSTNSETLSLYILPTGVDADDVDPVWVQEVLAGESAMLAGLLGQAVPNGGSIRAFASTTAVLRLTISGSVTV